MSPPVIEGTSFTGITGDQGPTRWRADGSSPAPTGARRALDAFTILDENAPSRASARLTMPGFAGAVQGKLATLGAAGAPGLPCEPLARSIYRWSPGPR